MKRAQIWFTDFVIASFIFVAVVVSFFVYSSDLAKNEDFILAELLSDAHAISDALLLTGYPIHWINSDVILPGITNNNQKINNSKINQYIEIDYNATRSLLATQREFFLYFEDTNNNPTPSHGICGMGNTNLLTEYNASVAYYFSDPTYQRMKDSVNGSFNATIYTDSNPSLDFDQLVNNIDTYSVVVFEHAELGAAQLAARRTEIENFVSTGNSLIVIGRISSTDGESLAGATYHRKPAQNPVDVNATITATTDAIYVWPTLELSFNQSNFIQNDSFGTVFNDAVIFVDGNQTAVSSWEYGNGSVTFVSDSAMINYAANMTKSIEHAVGSTKEMRCKPIDTDQLGETQIVRLERVVLSQNRALNMVVLVWV